MEEVKIYICTHTNFDCPVKNPVYEILDSRQLFKDDKADNGIDALFYSELLSYKYVADHYDLPEYIGFCGYRKYFSFMDDVPDIASLVEKHGCIATDPWKLKRNVYKHYAKCFCFADMDIAKAIVQGSYMWLYPTFCQMLKNDWLYTCNMFIMRKDDFQFIINVVWDCLDRLLAVFDGDVMQRINDHPQLYLNKKGVAAEVAHQFRIGGNIGERIISAYIMYMYPDALTYPIVLTEDRRPHRQVRV